MSKKKSNQTAVTAKTEKEVVAEVTETPAVDTVEASVVEGEGTEGDETPASDETPVDSVVTPVPEGSETPATDETLAVDGDADKPEETKGDETEVDMTPTVNGDKEKPEESESDEKQESVDASKMNDELMKNYKVRFAFSQNSKKYAAFRNMTLYNMIDIFMTNRQGFVGCVEQKDFDHIKDFVLHNPIIYKYQEFKLEGRKQFIARLEQNTDYVINFLK